MIILGFIVTLLVIKLYLKVTLGWCKSQVCLKGKTVVITGANTGIGYETALDLAKRGGRIILGCRNESKAKNACESIIKKTDNTNVTYKLVDFTSFKSVKKFAADIIANEERVDILVNNAGLDTNKNELTEDGMLSLMQVNYFSHVLLTMLLLDKLKETSGRIINVSSWLGRVASLSEKDLTSLNKYVGRIHQYPRSKLCLILFTIELSSRLKGTGVTVYSLHPGLVGTGIFKSFPKPIENLILFIIWLGFKTPEEGAQTTIFCAVEKGLEQYSGEHFDECQVVKRYYTASNPDMPKKLWATTMKLLGLTKHDMINIDNLINNN